MSNSNDHSTLGSALCRAVTSALPFKAELKNSRLSGWFGPPSSTHFNNNWRDDAGGHLWRLDREAIFS
jgi:hypothetical protein